MIGKLVFREMPSDLPEIKGQDKLIFCPEEVRCLPILANSAKSHLYGHADSMHTFLHIILHLMTSYSTEWCDT